MAAYEVLTINTNIPQIQAPQSGDTYSFPRVAEFSAGTAAAPALTTTGDTDTGVFFPAANTWAVATGASERMRITSGGNVGIQTTNPQAALDVVGSIRASAELRLSDDQLVRWGTSDSAGIIGKSGGSGGYLKLSANSEVARVKSEGQFRFIPRATDPGNAEAGDVYYNSGTNKLRVYNGTAWVDLH